MSGFDEGNVFVHDGDHSGRLGQDNSEARHSDVHDRFTRFIKGFKSSTSAYIYNDQLRQRYQLKEYFLSVSLEDLGLFDADLKEALYSSPTEVIPLLEEAARNIVRDSRIELEGDVHDIQVLFTSNADTVPIRTLKSINISKLVKIPGIVVSASRIQAKATSVTAMCKNCHATKVLPIRPGFAGIQLPKICESGGSTSAGADGDGATRSVGQGKCPPDPFVVLPDQSSFVDQQTLKLQEAPETIPTGEMPRHILLTVDRSLVCKAVPGTRVTAIGVYTIFQSSNAATAAGGKKNRETKGGASQSIRHPYMRVIGLEADGSAGGRASMHFSRREEEEFTHLARKPNLYDYIARNIAPAIFGHEDIKKAIACQLFGGSAKMLPDRMKLRGDINLLLLGDPGTAKSQLLKFVEKAAPIAVYTSGKGSSAAGLTASVVRDPSSREYYLEGGSMVLADGGVVCIDEFDKMNVNDRVAIHEAMEQQTISIAKAGITTILNSRTSVLAAANPVFGRYDDMRSAGDNIDFQATILSRFDLIFIVKDHRNEARDRTIAEHVMGIHMMGNSVREGDTSSSSARGAGVDPSDLNLQQIKRFVAFCRARCAPRLSEKGARLLQNHYVSVRKTVREKEIEGTGAP
eukprot:TRINITY_DN5686_c0_g2_i1.p1 TRINITY_DN5686_c0_g2~~TRINITY_DN5686_c0_g2_i1.p1  ORF type:complete len:632 (-),score=77.06 TRINITY_DN5686_c0_g2_i1:360-2255(-)